MFITFASTVYNRRLWEDGSMAPLHGIRALVTGGTSGIGASIAERLRSDAAAVVCTGRDEKRGGDVAARIW